MTLAAYETLKEKIIVGFFLPGQYLNEGVIADQLGLSRTPVHLALQRLQVEGLVEVVPRKGVIIQPDTAEQMIEILDARILVEAELVRSAAKNATKTDVQDLERILFSDGRSAGGAIDRFIDKDRAFHGKISSMSGNAILGDFARLLAREIHALLASHPLANAGLGRHRTAASAHNARYSEKGRSGSQQIDADASSEPAGQDLAAQKGRPIAALTSLRVNRRRA